MTKTSPPCPRLLPPNPVLVISTALKLAFHGALQEAIPPSRFYTVSLTFWIDQSE
jgi:hypothetical protein